MKFILHNPEFYNYSTDILFDKACRTPFNYFDIYSSGKVSVCCFGWLPEFCGNILTDSPDELLENSNRQLIMDKMRHGEFVSCADSCPHLNSLLTTGFSDSGPLCSINELPDAINNDSFTIWLSYDRSCNLQCPSCRKKLIYLNPDNMSDPDVSTMILIHEKTKSLINLLIGRGKKITLCITGSGDPFASPIYWEYLRELASMSLPDSFRIMLITNGILMTGGYWEEIKSLWKHIECITVSIDAATEETYKEVRKNGNFTTLKKNLSLLDTMISENKFENFKMWRAAFVVQQANYKELIKFVNWQLTYKNLNRIYLGLIRKWELSDSEYYQMSSIDPAELSQILSDPIFKNPRVRLGNLTAQIIKRSNI